MGLFVAQHVANWLAGADSWHMTGLPLFTEAV
jgi:hypothetical protein